MDKLKTLRELTGISFMECKKALDEADGDLELAKKILAKRGVEIAAKKAERSTSVGRIFSYVHHNGKIGSMIELLCETDFVAINDSFKTLGNDLAMQLAVSRCETKEELMGCEFIKDASKTVEAVIKDAIFAIGENIQIGKLVVFTL